LNFTADNGENVMPLLSKTHHKRNVTSPMTLFELVRQTLDNLYSACKYNYPHDTDEQITARLSYLSGEYENLSKLGGTGINYEDPATRFAYVFRYAAAHGDFVYQILKLLRNNRRGAIFAQEKVQVACIGGGPGSDLIGTLKYLIQHTDEPVRSLTFWQMDKEQAWQDAWAGVHTEIGNRATFNSYYQTLDVTNGRSWSHISSFLKSDLFTFSYFISEVMKFNGTGSVSDFLQSVFTRAKSGAYFLYDDNMSGGFTEFFDQECGRAGLVKLVTIERERWFPSYEEQRAELKGYVDMFGQNPKVQAYLSCRVYIKP
jgi:hypothetical protein